ncbi:MAG: hypothetical protein ABI361_08980 [Nitrososphaera sp.]|jgi:hypothetical protein
MIHFSSARSLSVALAALLAIGLLTPLLAYAKPPTVDHTSLFVGDVGDGTVKLFNKAIPAARSNVSADYQGVFANATSATTSNNGVSGLIFVNGTLLAASPCFYPCADNGTILKFDARTGAFKGVLVSPTEFGAPFNPRGMVLGPHNVLYVADLGDCGFPTGPENCGLIRTYDATSGAFLKAYNATSVLQPQGDQFNPRGVVFGPNGLLYISVYDTQNPLTGNILTLNTHTGKFSIFASSHTCACNLHRPEGLVFGHDGKLWVTSFRANSTDVDRLLAFDSKGKLVDSISLEKPGYSVRTYAQAILFGPGNLLFTPTSAGELRGYNVVTHSYSTIVNSTSTPLVAPWYLTFRGTDPSTLEFH